MKRVCLFVPRSAFFMHARTILWPRPPPPPAPPPAPPPPPPPLHRRRVSAVIKMGKGKNYSSSYNHSYYSGGKSSSASAYSSPSAGGQKASSSYSYSSYSSGGRGRGGGGVNSSYSYSSYSAGGGGTAKSSTPSSSSSSASSSSYYDNRPVVCSLNLAGGRKYVGKTNNFAARMDQHFSGNGAKWTQQNKYVSIRNGLIVRQQRILVPMYTYTCTHIGVQTYWDSCVITLLEFCGGWLTSLLCLRVQYKRKKSLPLPSSYIHEQ